METIEADTEEARMLHSILEPFSRNAQYFADNYEPLRRKYPDMWVAIDEERVVASDRNLRRLTADVRQQGYRAFFVGRTYFREKRPVLILPKKVQMISL